MAISSVNSADTAKMVSQVTSAKTNKPAETAPVEKKEPAPRQKPVTDTVKISSEAKAASEETREPKAEAAKEAAPGGREE